MGHPCNWVFAHEAQKIVMGQLGRTRSLTISSAVCIQSTNVTDWRTDMRRTDTGRQQRPRLRIASRGNKTGIEHCRHREPKKISYFYFFCDILGFCWQKKLTFSHRYNQKWSTYIYLEYNLPPHLNCVAALPCEVPVSAACENSHCCTYFLVTRKTSFLVSAEFLYLLIYIVRDDIKLLFECVEVDLLNFTLRSWNYRTPALFRWIYGLPSAQMTTELTVRYRALCRNVFTRHPRR